jgi:hypothetical protein
MAAPGEKSFCMLEYHPSKSVGTVQRAFRAKYAKDPPTDKTIRAWYKQFTENGCLCKQKSGGRPLTAEDDERVNACVKNLNIVLMCTVSPVVHTSNISSFQKNFFSFPVAVNNSIKVGPLVVLL